MTIHIGTFVLREYGGTRFWHELQHQFSRESLSIDGADLPLGSVVTIQVPGADNISNHAAIDKAMQQIIDDADDICSSCNMVSQSCQCKEDT